MKNRYQNFIFDLYGTLADIRTDEELPEVWQTAEAFLAPAGIFYAPDELKEAYFRRNAELFREQDAKLKAAGTEGPAEIEILDVWKDLAKEKGVDLPRKMQLELSHIFRERSTVKLRLFPAAEEVLKALKKAGKTICLLTNAQESFTAPELRKLGIESCFDFIFYSSREGVKKPSPVFFSKPLSVGLKAEESLMIGNDDICDCHGAAAAGMDSLYIFTEQSPKRTFPLPKNCREIKSLREILAFI